MNLNAFNMSSIGLVAAALFKDGYIALLGESDIGIGVRAINEWHDDVNKVVCFSKEEYNFLCNRTNKNIEIILDE